MTVHQLLTTQKEYSQFDTSLWDNSHRDGTTRTRLCFCAIAPAVAACVQEWCDGLHTCSDGVVVMGCGTLTTMPT